MNTIDYKNQLLSIINTINRTLKLGSADLETRTFLLTQRLQLKKELKQLTTNK
jgi:hypothetical protein